MTKKSPQLLHMVMERDSATMQKQSLQHQKWQQEQRQRQWPKRNQLVVNIQNVRAHPSRRHCSPMTTVALLFTGSSGWATLGGKHCRMRGVRDAKCSPGRVDSFRIRGQEDSNQQ